MFILNRCATTQIELSNAKNLCFRLLAVRHRIYLLNIEKNMNLTNANDSVGLSSNDKIGFNVQIQVPKWLSRYFKANSKTLSMLGLVIGAVVLTISMQHPASAQMFDKVQKDADKIQSFLPDLANGVEFVVEMARLLLFGGFFVGILGAAIAFVSNRGWESWLLVGSACLVVGGLIFAAETMVYGA